MFDVTLKERKDVVVSKATKPKYDWRYENSIISGKEVDVDGDYSQYRINNVLASHKDCVLYANEVNINYGITDTMHYNYLFNSIRKVKRWNKGETKEEKKAREHEQELHSLVSDYYKYNALRTKEALKILTADQINEIRRIKGG